MLNVKLTRNQTLDLMKEFPENHWMQNRLINALLKNDELNNFNEDVSEEELEKQIEQSFQKTANQETESVNTPLTANDIPLHSPYDNRFQNKEYLKNTSIKCDFDQSWVGRCNKPAIQGGRQCLQHFRIKCSMCGGTAVADCGETFALVCGSPLCQNHRNKHNCVRRNSMG